MCLDLAPAILDNVLHLPGDDVSKDVLVADSDEEKEEKASAQQRATIVASYLEGASYKSMEHAFSPLEDKTSIKNQVAEPLRIRINFFLTRGMFPDTQHAKKTVFFDVTTGISQFLILFDNF